MSVIGSFSNSVFGQNDIPRSTPFWQKNSLVTGILSFRTMANMTFSPVPNFGDQSLLTKSLAFRQDKYFFSNVYSKGPSIIYVSTLGYLVGHQNLRPG